MDNEYQAVEEILAVQGTVSTESIDQLEEVFNPETDEHLPLKASRSAAWAEMQQARNQYLKEWEEDMRFAQELANEGM